MAQRRSFVVSEPLPESNGVEMRGQMETLLTTCIVRERLFSVPQKIGCHLNFSQKQKKQSEGVIFDVTCEHL